MDVFDGFVDPVAFSKMALERSNAELNLWTDGYIRLAEQLAQEIEDAIPPGWQVVKDTLLNPENAEVVKSILSNQKFVPLSTGVAELSELSEGIKSIMADGCGPVWACAALKKRCAKAIEEGTNTVAMTFGLYQLTQVIPRLEAGKPRADAVAELKQAVAAKNATLGQSLEDECVRLTS